MNPVLPFAMALITKGAAMIHIRHLENRDIPVITEICRLGMEFDIWYEGIVREKTLDAKDYRPELGLVAEVDGVITGFAQGVFGERQGKPEGWARLLVVHPAFRCRGIGSALLKDLEKRLIALGAKTLSIMDVPANYHMPGVDHRYTESFCFLPKNGYKHGIPNINLICSVKPDMFKDDDLIESLKAQDFHCRRAEQSDWESLKKFLVANWACWVDEAASCFDTDPITLYICVHKGEVVGFSGYEGNNRGLGWFGPMGVDPVTRGKKMGAILCLLCLRDISLLGHKKAIIPWVGPVRFYDKVCGAVMDRIFWTWNRKVDG